MINCAIYPRKSKAVDNSDSMEIQISMCMQYLDNKFGKGNYLYTIYDGDYGITGHDTKKRKDFQRMMNDVKQRKIQLVVIQRFDRIARNTRDFCNLYHDMETNGCNLVSVSQQIDTTTPYGRNFMYMQASMAELEWSLCSERRKDAFSYGVKVGKCMFSDKSTPFGYKPEVINGIRRMVKDPKEEPIVHDIINHYAKYSNACSCARYINDKYDMQIEQTFIRRIVRSPFYKGEYRGNLNYCEPYLTIEQWEKLQVKKPAIRSDNGKKHEVLFTGMMKCPLCGRKMRGFTERKRSGNYIRRYRCEYHVAHICDFSRTKSEIKIEDWLLSKIESIINDKKVKIIMDNQKQETNNNKEKYKKELSRLNTMYQKGRIDEEYYDSEYIRITELINNTKEESIEILENLEKSFVGDWKDIYQELDHLHKKLFWREILKEIVVDKDFNCIDIIF